MNTKYLKVLQLIISGECVKTYPCHIFSALLPSSCHACHLKRISDIKPNPSTTRRVREHKMYFQNKNAIIMMYLFLLFKTHDFLHSILNIFTANRHLKKIVFYHLLSCCCEAIFMKILENVTLNRVSKPCLEEPLIQL